MANELKHDLTALGTTLQRTDWEDVNIHVFDSQATGDLAYASSATQISRLGIGAGDTVLSSQGGIPAWRTPANILTDLSGQAGAAFDWGGQNLTNLGSLAAHTLAGTVTINGQIFEATAGYVEINTTGRQGLQMDGGIVTGGATVFNHLQNYFGGDFVSGGQSSYATKFRLSGALTGFAGDIVNLTGARLGVTITTQTATQDVAYIAQLYLEEPSITNNLTGNISIAATLVVAGAPTEGLTNAAIYVVGGDMKFGGSLDSALVANQVAIGGFDIGGARSLAISQENPVVNEVLASDRTLPVRINGTDYKILLHT